MLEMRQPVVTGAVHVLPITQLPAQVQASVVQANESARQVVRVVQVAALPLHVWQVSGFASARVVHAVTIGANASPGHVAMVPLQDSARSHSLVAARQTNGVCPANGP